MKDLSFVYVADDSKEVFAGICAGVSFLGFVLSVLIVFGIFPNFVLPSALAAFLVSLVSFMHFESTGIGNDQVAFAFIAACINSVIAFVLYLLR